MSEYLDNFLYKTRYSYKMRLMRSIFAVLSILIAFGCYFPYMKDIAQGKAVPARSARIMFTVLMIIALLQQRHLGSGWALAVTIGEAAGSLAILSLAIKKGVGGLSRFDVGCYILLALSVIIWITTKNTFLALHLTVLADFIAFAPTLTKTWRWPQSETPFFFAAGVIAPLLSVVAQEGISYSVALFPLYLSLVNAVELVLIYRKSSILLVWQREHIRRKSPPTPSD
jgi:hypothetical protein